MTTKSLPHSSIIVSSGRKPRSPLRPPDTDAPRKPNPRRIREEGSTAAVTHYVETQWPGIGGEDLAPLPERAFLDPEFAEAYQPGHAAYVYVAGSGDTLKAPDQPTGLHGLARRFAMPLFKISATGAENALARIADLNLERYAGMYRAEAGLACDPGYDNWRLVLIHPSRKPLPGAPVEARPRVIRALLPRGLSLIGFEKELHERLGLAALGAWIASPAGTRHCADLGLNPREAMRLTGYNTGEGERVSRADELYVFKPRLDGGRLLTIVERIVHDYVVRDVAGQSSSWGWVAPNQGYRPARSSTLRLCENGRPIRTDRTNMIGCFPRTNHDSGASYGFPGKLGDRGK